MGTDLSFSIMEYISYSASALSVPLQFLEILITKPLPSLIAGLANFSFTTMERKAFTSTYVVLESVYK